MQGTGDSARPKPKIVAMIGKIEQAPGGWGAGPIGPAEITPTEPDTGNAGEGSSEAMSSPLWAARIIDTVAAFKAEDVVNRLDEIDTGEGDTSRSRAAKSAVRVYRLAIDGKAGPVAKALADAMSNRGQSSRCRVSREHLEEMLRWRIVAGVFAAEWGRFTRADLEHELQRLGEDGVRQTRAEPVGLVLTGGDEE